VWVPDPRWCRKYGVARPRLKETALDHGALAVEAALMRQGYRDTTAAITALHSEADLTSRARRHAGGRVQQGAQFETQPDLELVTRAGQSYAIEVITHNYSDEELAAKYSGILRHVEFVATSRTLALRMLRVVPGRPASTSDCREPHLRSSRRPLDAPGGWILAHRPPRCPCPDRPRVR
jgi:hypothetical protein